ncbi:multidrug efflux SMR transporter [uncultured Agrococcus sp.]|uniref:DMT family transporter n=1 Tax=uncultured Agrococcus sp. TaxID=382258 RepID=UPI0025D46E89|nr:multidrug efflux SMR transporter [uncultured Agrococcus sp.]
MRAWIILLLSAVFESVWALALSASEGFTNLVPSIVFVIAAIISLAGLGWAARDIPIGTAYGVWVGIGAAGTVAYSALTGQEQLSWAGWLCLVAIVGAVVGLKFTTPAKPAKPAVQESVE